jgi:hypothetical protein
MPELRPEPALSRLGPTCYWEPKPVPNQGRIVQIDRAFVTEELKKQGKSDQVQKAVDELPAKIDHEQHAALLLKFGIDPGELAEKAAKAGIAKL